MKDPNNKEFLALLAMAREKFGNYSRVAEQLKVKPAHISQWKDGKHRVPVHTVDALRRLVVEDKYPAREETVLLDAATGVGKMRNNFTAAPRTAAAPVISWARGGEGAYYEDQEHASPKIYVPCKDPNCYVLQLEGDSMHPVFLEGDLLVVAPNIPPTHNDVVIVKTTEEEVMCKILRHPRKAEVFEFHSYNPHYPPIFLRPDQIHRVSAVHSMIRPFKEKLRAMAIGDSAHL